MEIKVLDKKQFTEKGKAIYKRLESKLIEKKGKIVAIEIESGDYVIGDDELDAALKARDKFPDKIFTFFRIGYPVVHKFKRNSYLFIAGPISGKNHVDRVNSQCPSRWMSGFKGKNKNSVIRAKKHRIS